MPSKEGDDEEAKKPRTCPPGPADGAPSRHDWAPPAGVILLFNCGRLCHYRRWGRCLTLPESDDVDVVVGFNLQVIGRIRERKKPGEELKDRLELGNVWLPWRSQQVPPGYQPVVTLLANWVAPGRGKQQATILVEPWLAYGCSLGARLKVREKYATIIELCEDDSGTLVPDNATEGMQNITIDPRPTRSLNSVALV